MLEARRIRLGYPGCPPLPATLDFHLAAGELVALTGVNGAGKSLLALTLAGLIGPAAGEISLDGAPFPSPASGHDRVGMLFQDPESQLITGQVEREIAFPLENLGWPREKIDRRLSEVLVQLGIAHLAGRSLAGLSGGEKSRVALAAALAARPRFLILDEPGVYLDPGNRRRLQEVMTTAVADGLGILLITQLPEEWVAASRRLRLGPTGIDEAGIGELPLAGPPASAGPEQRGEPVLTARRVSFEYPDSGLVPTDSLASAPVFSLRQIDLELHAGETVFLVGESGSGKTTLLLLLAGVLEPTGGELLVHPGSPGTRPETRFGVLLQSPEDQLVSATVLDDVLLGLREAGIGRREAEDRARRALARAGLDPTEIAPLPPSFLSHGQRRRAAWCGIWVLEAGIWLLDEPTAGLDEEGLRVLQDAIAGFTQTGGAVVMATQDPRLTPWPGRRVALDRTVPEAGDPLARPVPGGVQKPNFA